MPTIGYDEIGVNSAETAGNWFCEGLVGSAYRYTAVSGDEVTEVFAYGDGTGTCEVAVYVFSGGVPTTRVGSPVSISIGSTAAWYSATTSIALTAGVEYCVGVDYQTGEDPWNMRYASPGGTTLSLTSVQALPSTWSQIGTSGDVVSFYALVGSADLDADVQAAVVTATSEVPAPTVALGAVAGPATVETLVDVPLPSVSAGGSAAVDAPVVGLVGEVSAPTIGVGITFVPSVVETSVNVLQAVLVEPPWPTSISGRKVLDQNGNVYLMKVMSSWGMSQNLSNAEMDTALEDVAANGFNGVNVWMGGGANYGSDWSPRYQQKSTGQNFFTGTAWQSPLGTAWASVDHLMQKCVELGLHVVFSFNGGFGSYGARADWEAASNAQMYQVGAAIATRYAAYPNIIWHVMFDDSIATSDTAGQRIDALFDGINDTEGASHRPIRWLEVNNGNSINEQGWLGTTNFNATLNGMYEYGTNSVELCEAVRGEAGATTVPWGDQEPPYDGSPHYGGAMAQNLRERSWAVFIEGGMFINYGHENWWPFGLTGLFSESLTWDEVQAHSHTVEQSYCWYLVDLICADTSYDHDGGAFLTSGVGSGDTKAAAGFSNTSAIAYFPASRSIIVDTTVLAGTGNVQLRWYDPTNGTFTSIATSEAQTSGRSVTYPASNNSAGGTDWVLLVNTVANPSAVEVQANVSVPSPTVTTSGQDVNVGPSVVAAPVEAPAPTVGAGVSVTATEITITAEVPAPAISAGGGADVSAAVVTATVGVVAPAAVGGTASVEPNSIDAAVDIPAPTVSVGSRPTPSVVELQASPLLPVLIGDPITLARHRCPPSNWG